MSNTDDPSKRGQFQPGNTAGKGRRPKRVRDDIAQMLEEGLDGPGARMLIEAMTKSTKLCGKDAVEHPDWPTRIHAYEVIRDTVRGRPAQVITGEDGPLNLGVLIMPAEDAGG